MKIIKGLMLLLAAGILAAGCYWTPNEGEAELSLILPKSITEKAPPDLYYARIYIEGDGDIDYNTDYNYFELAMPSFAKAPQGVIPIKLPLSMTEYTLTKLEIGTYTSGWDLKYMAKNEVVFSVLLPGRTKVVVELTTP